MLVDLLGNLRAFVGKYAAFVRVRPFLGGIAIVVANSCLYQFGVLFLLF
jgi:hypothetical protein